MTEKPIPVAREELEVAKERRESKVTIKKEVHQEIAPVDIDVSEDTVDIRRLPMERWVDGPVPDRHDGDTLVVSVLQEVLVVEKRLKVVEEIHITRRASSHRVREEHALRREEVRIERPEH